MASPTIAISCDECALQDTDACDDCLVSFVLSREPDDAVVIDADEARAVRMLARAGLVPTLRFASHSDGCSPSSPWRHGGLAAG